MAVAFTEMSRRLLSAALPRGGFVPAPGTAAIRGAGSSARTERGQGSSTGLGEANRSRQKSPLPSRLFLFHISLDEGVAKHLARTSSRHLFRFMQMHSTNKLIRLAGPAALYILRRFYPLLPFLSPPAKPVRNLHRFSAELGSFLLGAVTCWIPEPPQEQDGDVARSRDVWEEDAQPAMLGASPGCLQGLILPWCCCPGASWHGAARSCGCSGWNHGTRSCRALPWHNRRSPVEPRGHTLPSSSTHGTSVQVGASKPWHPSLLPKSFGARHPPHHRLLTACHEFMLGAAAGAQLLRRPRGRVPADSSTASNLPLLQLGAALTSGAGYGPANKPGLPRRSRVHWSNRQGAALLRFLGERLGAPRGRGVQGEQRGAGDEGSRHRPVVMVERVPKLPVTPRPLCASPPIPTSAPAVNCSVKLCISFLRSRLSWKQDVLFFYFLFFFISA